MGRGFVFRKKPLLWTKMLLHSTASRIANGRERADDRLSSTAMTGFVYRFLKNSFFQLALCTFSWHNAYKMQFRHISLQNIKLLLFASVKGCVWPEHSGSIGELWERQQRWNALVSLRDTSDILGSFPYNPQPNKMLWEYFLTETFHQFISWKRILFERMKHRRRLNGLSLGQGMISVLSGHSTLQTWWLNDNGSISTKVTLTA